MEIKKKKTSKAVIITVLVIVFVLAGGAGYWYLNSNGFFDRSGEETEQTDGDGDTTNVEDKNATDPTLSSSKNDDDKPPVEVDDSGKKVAQVGITYASQNGDVVEVRSGVNNIIEESGTCQYIFTQNSLSLTRTNNAIFTGTGMNCETINIPVKDFPAKGEWQMVVKYTSSTAAGTSQTKTVMLK